MATKYTGATEYDKQIKNVKSYYDSAVKDYNAKANADYNRAVQQSQKQADSQLKEAYINRMQNQRNLNQNLAIAGIRGGATETSNIKLANQYGQARSGIYSDLSSAITQAGISRDENKFNYANQMATAKAEAVQNLQGQKMQYVQDQRAQYYQALYNKNYSVKKLKKALKKASSKEQKQAINARIAYLTEHKKGY